MFAPSFLPPPQQWPHHPFPGLCLFLHMHLLAGAACVWMHRSQGQKAKVRQSERLRQERFLKRTEASPPSPHLLPLQAFPKHWFFFLLILGKLLVSDEAFVPHVCVRKGTKRERKIVKQQILPRSQGFWRQKELCKINCKKEIRKKIIHNFPQCLAYFYNCAVNECCCFFSYSSSGHD